MTPDVPTPHPIGRRLKRLAIAVALSTTAALTATTIDGRGQEAQSPAGGATATATEPKLAPSPSAAKDAAVDPRVGLKPGLRNAGSAARHLQLVASVPKPDGFFDPKNPAGQPTAAEKPRPANATTDEDAAEAPEATPAKTTDAKPGAPAAASGTPAAKPGATESTNGGGSGAATPARPSNALGFANSDLVFKGDHLIVGSFHGFNTYTIDGAKKPKLLASVVCPGGQGDVSIHGDLLFMSVEQTRGRLDCGTGGVPATVSPERFRGVRIFDISDLRNPKQIAAVQTCRGSHTHTLVTSPKDTANVYIYGSGTSTVRSAEELDGCSGLAPDKDPNTALFSIDVIQVPLAAPATAKIVNRPRIFTDPKTGAIAGLWEGGDHGPGTQRSRMTNQCHDITVYPEVGLAAGACSGNGILLDIADPVNPVRLDAVTDKGFAYWHSATFNNDGTKVVFTDEWGGGTRPRCRATDLPNWGANAIFDIVDRKLRFASYYKMPAAQTDQENCVAHNGSIVPVPGRDIMVQAWYQGGVSVFDFTDSAHPYEIAFFDRGPLDAKQLYTGGYWSTYWYNGHVYGAEIARGLDVFTLTPSEFLSKHEIDAAAQVKLDAFNAQDQPRIVWPATSVVARAYVDQLGRAKGLPPARAQAVTAALDRADKIASAQDKNAAAAATALDTLAGEVEQDAAAASGREAETLKSLAATLKGRSAALR